MYHPGILSNEFLNKSQLTSASDWTILFVPWGLCFKGPVAQRQSGRLITVWSLVRIQPGPPVLLHTVLHVFHCIPPFLSLWFSIPLGVPSNDLLESKCCTGYKVAHSDHRSETLQNHLISRKPCAPFSSLAIIFSGRMLARSWKPALCPLRMSHLRPY
jgi:hypothetical protein